MQLLKMQSSVVGLPSSGKSPTGAGICVLFLKTDD